MTVGDLIKQLENEDKNKIVVLQDSMGGWQNVKNIIESYDNTIALVEDDYILFDD
jgi:hypothetical protein